MSPKREIPSAIQTCHSHGVEAEVRQVDRKNHEEHHYGKRWCPRRNTKLIVGPRQRGSEGLDPALSSVAMRSCNKVGTTWMYVKKAGAKAPTDQIQGR